MPPRWRLKALNASFSEQDDEAILASLEEYVSFKGISRAVFKRKLLLEAKPLKGGVVKAGLVAKLDNCAGQLRRHSDSVVERMLVLLRHEDETMQRLLDLVAYHGTAWGKIGAFHSMSASEVKMKFEEACQPSLDGSWSEVEDKILWHSIVRLSDELVPMNGIAWKEVATCLPARKKKDIKSHWYNALLPELQGFETEHGHPVPADVLHRLIVRNLRECGCDHEVDVEWQDVNRFWKARRNKSIWKRLQESLPDRLKPIAIRSLAERPTNPADVDDDPGLEDRVSWLYAALKVERFRMLDDRLLGKLEPLFGSQMGLTSAATSGNDEAGDDCGKGLIAEEAPDMSQREHATSSAKPTRKRRQGTHALSEDGSNRDDGFVAEETACMPQRRLTTCSTRSSRKRKGQRAQALSENGSNHGDGLIAEAVCMSQRVRMTSSAKSCRKQIQRTYILSEGRFVATPAGPHLKRRRGSGSGDHYRDLTAPIPERDRFVATGATPNAKKIRSPHPSESCEHSLQQALGTDARHPAEHLQIRGLANADDDGSLEEDKRLFADCGLSEDEAPHARRRDLLLLRRPFCVHKGRVFEEVD